MNITEMLELNKPIWLQRMGKKKKKQWVWENEAYRYTVSFWTLWIKERRSSSQWNCEETLPSESLLADILVSEQLLCCGGPECIRESEYLFSSVFVLFFFKKKSVFSKAESKSIGTAPTFPCFLFVVVGQTGCW